MQLVKCVSLLLLYALTAGVQGALYQAQFTAVKPGRAAGSVLVLDVSSLWQKYPTQSPYSVISTDECQQRCAALPGCTGYAFCGNTAGCGTGCKAYTTKHPALLLSRPVPNKRGEASKEAGPKIPILSFGPYVANKTAGCDEKVPDKWGFGTCTLLAGTQANKLLPATAGAGWSSAWLSNPVPSTCSGLSAKACAACYSTPKADVCLTCMRDKRAAAYASGVSLIGDGMPAASTGNRMLDQCVTCAQLGTVALQKQCTACVLDAAACSSCVSYPGAATQVKLVAVQGCIDCVRTKGKRFTGTCLTCSTTASPDKCFTCLKQFYPARMCKTSTYLDCYKPDFDNPCAVCQNGAPEAYESCIGCYNNPASKPDCDFCSALADKKEHSSCYSCSKQSQAAHSDVPGGCGLCFAHSKDAYTQGQCIKCVANSNTPKPHKQHCHLCASTEMTQNQASLCYKCLASPVGGPDCSICAQATTSEGAFNRCMACYNTTNNRPDCDECSTLQDPTVQGSTDATRQQCYDCVINSKLAVTEDAGFAPLGSCAICFAGAGDGPSCITCNTNPATITPAKAWCGTCSFLDDADKRSACFDCLRINKLPASADYPAKCRLSL